MNRYKGVWKKEREALRAELNRFEYYAWWIMRAAMAVTLVMVIKQRIFDEGVFDIRIAQIALNIFLSFIIPILRLVFAPFNTILNRLTFRCQSWLNITIFLASFFGQGLDLYHSFINLDKIIHFVTGGSVVLIGNEIITATMKKDDKISPLTRTVASMGLSYFAIVVWELIEFIFDYFWVESALQRYYSWDKEDCADTIFVKIFGQSANEGIINSDGELVSHWPLYDTNFDMLYAFVACAIVGTILYVYLSKKDKKENAASEKKEKSAVKV